MKFFSEKDLDWQCSTTTQTTQTARKESRWFRRRVGFFLGGRVGRGRLNWSSLTISGLLSVFKLSSFNFLSFKLAVVTSSLSDSLAALLVAALNGFVRLCLPSTAETSNSSWSPSSPTSPSVVLTAECPSPSLTWIWLWSFVISAHVTTSRLLLGL